MALYSDHHAVFKHNARKGETAAEATQFTRALPELGIRQIFARSLQAKGWVERMAETFQGRLVTELRLADARTIDQATAVLRDFLPRFNAWFAVQAEHPEPAYRPVAPDLRRSETLCFKDTRKVALDNTVKYHWRVLQLLPDQDAPATPDCAWRCWNVPTAKSSSSTKVARWLPRSRRHGWVRGGPRSAHGLPALS